MVVVPLDLPEVAIGQVVLFGELAVELFDRHVETLKITVELVGAVFICAFDDAEMGVVGQWGRGAGEVVVFKASTFE